MLTTNVHSQTEQETTEQMIDSAIKKAREELTPISRRMLALMISQKKSLPFKEAMDIVDEYCDEHAPAVPGYVSSEFIIYWLKAVAVFFVLIGLGIVFWGVSVFRVRGVAWPHFAGGTIVIGLGALAWVKSLEREFSRR